ncbi:hypothetical protein NS14008_35885 [Nocardia seriolae]|nr:hypothetical protein NS14008_35885 [Nocardia seriolae]PSK28577.1 hypothetical protein C6575_25740 [Nocardia seriolae]RLP29172.1 hypothetical protein D6158_25415 [Nocardia seriolae]
MRGMARLPEWVKVTAAVRFRVSGRDAVECWIDQAGDRGVLLSNGERFGIGHLRRGNSDDTSYFEKYDARAGVRKTVRRK